MKLINTLAIGALVLATAGAASAQTVIRIVASNGDRGATQTAISKLLASGWTYQGIGGSTSSSGTLSVAVNSNFGAWKGTYAGNSVVIKTSYAGALAGIAAVAGHTLNRFVVSNGTGTGAVPNPSTGTTEGTDYEQGFADFGLSTNFQATSPFNGVVNGVTYNKVTEEKVGISPLVFVASPGFPAASANITTQLAQQLYKNGFAPLSLFTGLPADENKIVYAIGRNTDAGQRYGTYTEIGLGTTTAVQVWKPSITGATTDPSNVVYGGTANSHVLWPQEIVSGIDSGSPGNGGFGTGADLAPALTSVLGPNAYKLFDASVNDFIFPNATAGYYIGYLTPNDANSRVLGGVVAAANRGVLLKYNGVDYTPANVQNGSYTPWVYNRVLTPKSGLTGLPLTFANALRDQIKNTDATVGGGLKDDASFRVERFQDGGPVTLK
ncbi:MAG: hypothetical protein JWL90_1922 [Chthoniobacteraceae bacterium]|nr:hypothetical protein [Chthoniobacteraceae bacterium]